MMEDNPRRLSLPMPRLLPVTVACLGTLLAVKSIALVRAAAPATAPAAAQPQTPPQPQGQPQGQPAGAQPGAPKPGTAAKPAPAARPAPAAQQAAPPVAPAPEQTPAAPVAAATPAPAAEQAPPVSDSERAVLLELRQRRQELETRAQEAAARDALLAATERRIGQRVEELKALQARLEALENNRRERDDASWRGLVKVYETMKPRDAATIMNDLDQTVLLGVLDRMKEAKAAAVLAAMLPDRARQITTELAQHRQRANMPARPAVATTPPARGG